MRKRIAAIIITVVIPIIFILIFVMHKYILALVSFVPPCLFYSIYHLYCPACGNTRSVLAFLQGDILTSLRFNVVPSLLFIIMFLGYIELITYSFGRYRRILPRKLSFYLTAIALVVLYLIVRNFIPYLTP